MTLLHTSDICSMACQYTKYDLDCKIECASTITVAGQYPKGSWLGGESLEHLSLAQPILLKNYLLPTVILHPITPPS